MRIFNHSTAETHRASDVEVARWEQFGIGNAMPFGAMWYTVPAGATTSPDRHPEMELSVVVAGCGAVRAGDSVSIVAAGDAFLIDGDETHLVHNLSPDPLLVFSAYWLVERNAVGPRGEVASDA
jgi:quercetin dioxygenase-like cupin family protein